MSFEELLKKVSPVLKRITYKLRGYSALFNEDDLFQEALIHLWEDFNAGKLSDKTDSYILQGCYFHLKNYIRKSRVKIRLVSLETIINKEGTSLEETLFLKDDRRENSPDYINDKMLVDTIQNNGFTRREKDMLSFYAEGLTTREIGKRIGVSHVSVVKMTARIKDKCKKYI
jgi:RNA polymerase sigma factor (sigma-70 family)